MMIERIILLAGITLLLITLLTLLKKQQLKQAQSAASQSMTSQSVTNQAVDNSTSTKPQVIYFWSTQCSQCKTVQTPIIERLASIIGEDTITVSKFNVSESVEQAKTWGVKTVPTTYVLDSAGKVQHVNNGLAAEKLLVAQIEGLNA